MLSMLSKRPKSIQFEVLKVAGSSEQLKHSTRFNGIVRDGPQTAFISITVNNRISQIVIAYGLEETGNKRAENNRN